MLDLRTRPLPSSALPPWRDSTADVLRSIPCDRAACDMRLTMMQPSMRMSVLS